MARIGWTTLGWVGLLSASAVCRQPSPSSQSPDHKATPLRDVRVLILSGMPKVRIGYEDALVAVDEDDNGLTLPNGGEWLLIEPAGNDKLRMKGGERPVHRLTIHSPETAQLVVSTFDDGWKPARRYWGSLELTVDDSRRLRGVNQVDVERYVGCVVAYEAWPTFKMAAVQAQAVAARTFVIDQMIRRNQADFDVSATQNSQVYRGIRDDEAGRRAALAALQTRGVVCAWRDGEKVRLFPTYYSAACGGSSQSGAVFGPESDVGPLSGGVKCDYCKIAPGKTYRWGPVKISLGEVRSKLRSRFKNLSSLKRIDVTERTPSGRPIKLRLTDSNGTEFDILAEQFRHALGPSRIRSTDFKLRLRGKYVHFTDGRGFGHGLGMCQWGAEGLARQGKGAADILRFYYPGCLLSRVY